MTFCLIPERFYPGIGPRVLFIRIVPYIKTVEPVRHNLLQDNDEL